MAARPVVRIHATLQTSAADEIPPGSLTAHSGKRTRTMSTRGLTASMALGAPPRAGAAAPSRTQGSLSLAMSLPARRTAPRGSSTPVVQFLKGSRLRAAKQDPTLRFFEQEAQDTAKLLKKDIPRRARELLKRLRASKRRAAALVLKPRVPQDPLSLRILKGKGVGKSAMPHCLDIFKRFTEYAMQGDLATVTPGETDLAALEFLDFIFLEGDNSSLGEKLIAALMQFWTDLAASGKMALPRSRRAVKSFLRRAPPRGRDPMPWLWVVAIAGALLWRGRWETARVTLVAFKSYARPSSLLAMKSEDLLLPVARSGLERCPLLLHPACRDEVGKTGTQDDTIILDWLDIDLSQPLLQLRQNRVLGEKLFKITATQFRGDFALAAIDVGLQDREVIPYMLRHSVASCDTPLGRRDLEACRQRLGHQTSSPVRRYEKSGGLHVAIASSPPSLEQYVRDTFAAEGPPALPRGSRAAAPRPPRA